MIRKYKLINSNEKNAFNCFQLLFISLFLIMPSTILAQTKTVLINDNKISIEQAFLKIEKQTGYLFVFDKSVVDLNKRIELPNTQTGLNEMLDLILKNTGCEYRIHGNNIVVIKTQAISPKNSQITPIITQTITGVVIDEDTRHPLMRVKVYVSGVVGKDTETDHAGRFTITNIPAGNQRIRASIDGYYISESGLSISSAMPHELEIRMKSISLNLGSIRNDVTKSDIVTVETSSEATVGINTLRKESVVVEIPTMKTHEILLPYHNNRHYNHTKVGIKTNLLYLATMTPNIGIEWAMGRKWTAEVTAGLNLFDYAKIFQKDGNMSFNHWIVKPELKYWLCRAFDGHFFGIHGLGGQFDIGELPFNWIKNLPNDYSYRGWAYGGGMTYGYQWAIGKRLNLEASIGIGYVRLEYNAYQNFNNCRSCRGRSTSDYFGPTKAGISLIYTFK